MARHQFREDQNCNCLYKQSIKCRDQYWTLAYVMFVPQILKFNVNAKQKYYIIFFPCVCLPLFLFFFSFLTFSILILENGQRIFGMLWRVCFVLVSKHFPQENCFREALSTFLPSLCGKSAIILDKFFFVISFKDSLNLTGPASIFSALFSWPDISNKQILRLVFQ